MTTVLNAKMSISRYNQLHVETIVISTLPMILYILCHLQKYLR